jgi:hypothetical protein
MERFFLAIMVSGLLLAVVAVSLFVVTRGGDPAVSVMNLPAAPSTPNTTVRPRRAEGNRTMPQDDGRR